MYCKLMKERKKKQESNWQRQGLKNSSNNNFRNQISHIKIAYSCGNLKESITQVTHRKKNQLNELIYISQREQHMLIELK